MVFDQMDLLIIAAFILSIWAQFRVKGTFNRWSKVEAASGLTGYQAAQKNAGSQRTT